MLTTEPDFRNLGNVLNAKETNAQLFDGLVLHFCYRHCLNGCLPRLEVDSIADVARGWRSDAALPTPESGTENL